MTSTFTHALALTLAGILSTGCVTEAFDSDESASEASGDEPGDDREYDRDDCKIEGAQIGVVGLELRLGDVTVVFDSWTAKAGEPNEFMGFSFHTTGRSVGYVVKAGGDRYHSTDESWVHPDGTQGPVSAISNVDFCEECEEPGGCEPGDPNDPDDPDDPDDPGTPDPGDPTDPGDPGECQVDEDCATGEFCEGGTCLPIVN